MIITKLSRSEEDDLENYGKHEGEKLNNSNK
jgi:hypothetical protein